MADQSLRHPVNVKHHVDASLGERLADQIAAAIGSWRFVITQNCLITLWIGINALAFAFRWDPYPFILLNLCLSVQAAETGPLLLLAGNRQAAKDRATMEHDYLVNQEAHAMLQELGKELEKNSVATLAILQRVPLEDRPSPQ